MTPADYAAERAAGRRARGGRGWRDVHMSYFGEREDAVLDGMTKGEYFARLNRLSRQDDAQEFLQVYNLGDVELGSVIVSLVQVTGEFRAEARVYLPGRKRSRIVMVFGEGRAATLEKLTSAVAALLYPVGAAPVARKQAQSAAATADGAGGNGG